MSDAPTVAELAALEAAVDDAGVVSADARAVVGRWLARPTLGLGAVPGGAEHPVWLGGSVGRAWWGLGDGLTGTVQTVASAQAPLGPAVRGADLRWTTLAGIATASVRVQVGPEIGFHRLRWSTGDLPDAPFVGGRVAAVVDSGVVSLSAEHAALWCWTDARMPANGWPGWGDEPEWRAGIGLHTGLVQWRLDATHRSTAAGPLVLGNLSLRIRP
jgi:hypothetical protein